MGERRPRFYVILRSATSAVGGLLVGMWCKDEKWCSCQASREIAALHEARLLHIRAAGRLQGFQFEAWRASLVVGCLLTNSLGPEDLKHQEQLWLEVGIMSHQASKYIVVLRFCAVCACEPL